MGTRSRIGILQNRKIESIYCHYDGYPEHNGKKLWKHYRKTSLIQELMDMGDMSVLDKNIGDKVDFDDFEERKGNEQCLFYGRDRGEEGVESFTIPVDQVYKYNEEFFYLWSVIEKRWYVSAHEENKKDTVCFVDLERLIKSKKSMFKNTADRMDKVGAAAEAIMEYVVEYPKKPENPISMGVIPKFAGAFDIYASNIAEEIADHEVDYGESMTAEEIENRVMMAAEEAYEWVEPASIPALDLETGRETLISVDQGDVLWKRNFQKLF